METTASPEFPMPNPPTTVVDESTVSPEVTSSETQTENLPNEGANDSVDETVSETSSTTGWVDELWSSCTHQSFSMDKKTVIGVTLVGVGLAALVFGGPKVAQMVRDRQIAK